MIDYPGRLDPARVLVGLGGVAMIVSSFLAWSVTCGFAGVPYRDLGVDNGYGIATLAAGIVALVVAAVRRLLPLGIAAGLAGGIAAGLFLLHGVPLRFVSDAATQAANGVVFALGGGALAGAGGVVAVRMHASPRSPEVETPSTTADDLPPMATPFDDSQT